MTMEEIFCGMLCQSLHKAVIDASLTNKYSTGRDALKKNIQGHIKGELAQFGLKIYNANVKELEDAPGSSYFASQSKKAHEGAINQARIDVADAMRLGNVGEAQRLGEQDREIAKIHAETAVQRTERDSERAEAEAVLAKRRTGFSRDVDITKIEANRATEVRDEELKKDVEIKRCHTELERLRAVDVVKATIDREAKQQSADAKNYEEQARANAGKFPEPLLIANILTNCQLSIASKRLLMLRLTNYASTPKPTSLPNKRMLKSVSSPSRRKRRVTSTLNKSKPKRTSSPPQRKQRRILCANRSKPQVCPPWLVPTLICLMLSVALLVSSSTS